MSSGPLAMARGIGLAIASVAALALALPAPAPAEVVQAGNLQVTFDARLLPRQLPRSSSAPISVRLRGGIRTVDGSPPPALTTVTIAFNRRGRVDYRGLPSCGFAELENTTTAQALSSCGRSLVGKGPIQLELAFPGSQPIPATASVLLFNASHGKGPPRILLHAFSTDIAPQAAVVEVAVRRTGRGFGNLGTVEIPPLGGGFGSITGFDLRIGRRYSFRGQRRSYLSAACPAPPGFTVALFSIARASYLFNDGRQLNAVLERSCRVKGRR